MNKKGFTLVEIMIVVAIIGLLAAIAIPSFMGARTRTQANTCVNNMRQIEGAKEQFAMDEGLKPGAEIEWTNLVGKTKYIKVYPICPLGEGTDLTGTQDSYGDNTELDTLVVCLKAGEDVADYDGPRHVLPIDIED